MKSVLFGGPYDRRELDVPGGTEKISLPVDPKKPEEYLTYEYQGVGEDSIGQRFLVFHLNDKTRNMNVLLAGG